MSVKIIEFLLHGYSITEACSAPAPLSSKQALCADISFLNFNVVFSGIVYTIIWKEGCANKFGIIYKRDIVAYFKHIILLFVRRS
jgi:hypothetical protein